MMFTVLTLAFFILLICLLVGKIKRLESCVIDLLWICDHGKFSNGNVCGAYDEGEVLARKTIDKVREMSGVECPWE